jgi:hypothetical protein
MRPPDPGPRRQAGAPLADFPVLVLDEPAGHLDEPAGHLAEPAGHLAEPTARAFTGGLLDAGSTGLSGFIDRERERVLV